VPVAVEVEEGLPPISFDPVLLRGIVVNLLDNAVKYSAGAPTRAVAVRLAREGGGVALVVTDRGPGIPEDARRHLFEPFARGGREETRTTQGVGLGLALVKRYADALRARVSVESAAGAGTTVRVHFPV
jgi:two-component system sensor histidine kinase KdpD